MDEWELNRKLAEWAGLDIKHTFEPCGVAGIEACIKCGTVKPALLKYCKLPDFTQSLDACFKWLVPKARKEFGVTRIEFCYIREEVACRLSGGYGALLELSGSPIVKRESDALCLTIEKLIDKE